jgi:uncharacterized protein (UPF0335 family)
MTETTANVEISGEALRRYVEPIEELMGDRQALNRKITAVYRKAKEAGYQTPILRVIIAERALEPQVWADQQTLLQQYRQALGMFADTPLGEAAMQSAYGDRHNDPLRTEPSAGPMASAEEDLATRRADNIAATEASRDARNGSDVKKPKPFAEQPLHNSERKRGRRKPVLFDQEHPQGTA